MVYFTLWATPYTLYLTVFVLYIAVKWHIVCEYSV